MPVLGELYFIKKITGGYDSESLRSKDTEKNRVGIAGTNLNNIRTTLINKRHWSGQKEAEGTAEGG